MGVQYTLQDLLQLAIDSCYFVNNSAVVYGLDGGGGGTIALQSARVRIVNSYFINNSAIEGGGIYCIEYSRITIIGGSYFILELCKR